MALFDYLKTAQRYLREAKQDLINPADLVTYCNRARREVAMRAQAIRILTPISGQIVSAIVTNPGSGYTNPTVVISAPDFPAGTSPYPQGLQATGLATLHAGAISGVIAVAERINFLDLSEYATDLFTFRLFDPFELQHRGQVLNSSRKLYASKSAEQRIIDVLGRLIDRVHGHYENYVVWNTEQFTVAQRDSVYIAAITILDQ